jgi:hypothetical protein
MIEDAPIVKDIRKIRCAISQQFDDDLDRYIDYLRSQPPKQIILKEEALPNPFHSKPEKHLCINNP